MIAGPEFEEFVLADGPALVAFARRLTLDHHRGEDLVQEVLARAALSWARYRELDDPRAYFHTAVLREFLSWRRRLSSRERPVADPDRARPAVTPGIEEGVLLRAEARRALARLRPMPRAVLVLRYYEDLSDARIAELLGCREATVRSHARRGLAALRTVTGAPPDRVLAEGGRS